MIIIGFVFTIIDNVRAYVCVSVENMWRFNATQKIQFTCTEKDWETRRVHFYFHFIFNMWRY